MNIKQAKPRFHLYIAKSDPNRININRNLYVLQSVKTQWEVVKSKEEGHYYFQRLNRAMIHLATNPGPRQVGMQRTVIGPISITFRIDEGSGDIEVHHTVVDDAPEYTTKQTPGLYRVNADQDKWNIERDTDVAMDFTHHWGDNEHNAAIAGKFKSKEDAGKIIPEHIVNAYTVSSQNSKSPDNHYSLYWLNNDFKNTQHVNSIVHHLREAHKSKRRVRWLVHGEATTVFAEALDLVAKTGELKAEKKTQRVFFSNPRGAKSRKSHLENICTSANIEFAGLQLNEHDIFRNKDALVKATFKPAHIAMGATGVGFGFEAATGAENVLKAINTATAVGSSTMTTIGYGAVAALITTCVIGPFSRSLWDIGNTTFGKGNQQWAGN
jgi:hypothetical protein